MKNALSKLTLAALLASSAIAHAANIEVNVTWDLNGPGMFSLGGPVSIANGDHVTYNVDFAGNQALNFSGAGQSLYTWLASNDNSSSFTLNTISLDLVGFVGTGGASSSYSKPSESGGAAHLGPTWNNLLSAGQTASFSGFMVEFDVQSIAVSPHSYNSAWLMQSGGNVGTAQDVPEPLPIALIGIGLAGIGFARRNKQLNLTK